MTTARRGGPWGWFSDFDGTIAEQDMNRAILMHFVPEQAEPLIRAVNQRELSVREGLERMFGLIPSRWLDDIRAYALREVRLRPGFGEFVNRVHAEGDRLWVVSSGFSFFLEPVLAPWADRLTLYCNRIDPSGDYLRVIWPHPCDEQCHADCGLCKPTIQRRHRAEVTKVITIGDGVTDFEAAAHADFVFARAALLEHCGAEGYPHAAFETFHDIVAQWQAPLTAERETGGNRG